MTNDYKDEQRGYVMTTVTSESDAVLDLAQNASADFNDEFLAELQELAAEIAEAMGDGLIAVLLGGRYGRSQGPMSLQKSAEPACGDVNLYLVTASSNPRGMEKLPAPGPTLRASAAGLYRLQPADYA